ncbi:MAG TPA: cyclic nucleotide-binding domain-containing protein [Acidimicrobiales bacterium]|nr:cyclic nucleotide-binding domain-containing protein [Acidimicrobiales bacterium]
MGILGVDVDLVQLESTPLQMLVVILILTLVAAVVLIVVTQVSSRLVDRRWPATQALSPSEMLWAEGGGHVQRTFKGLDLDLAKDLASHMVEKKVPAGSVIVEEGEPATHFFTVKKGKADAVRLGAAGGQEVVKSYGPGQSFGETAILQRVPQPASVKAVTDCVLLQLPAEDFLAGVTLSAADESDIFEVVEGYLAADHEQVRLAADVAGAGADEGTSPVATSLRTTGLRTATVRPTQQRQAPATVSLSTEERIRQWKPTHVVPEGGIKAWSTSDMAGEAAAELQARVELVLVEQVGPAARVVGSNGWEGWVEAARLVPAPS